MNPLSPPLARRRKRRTRLPKSPSARLLSLPDTATILNRVIQDQFYSNPNLNRDRDISRFYRDQHSPTFGHPSSTFIPPPSPSVPSPKSPEESEHCIVINGIEYFSREEVMRIHQDLQNMEIEQEQLEEQEEQEEQEKQKQQEEHKEQGEQEEQEEQEESAFDTTTTNISSNEFYIEPNDQPTSLAEMRKRKCCMRAWQNGAQLLSIAQEALDNKEVEIEHLVDQTNRLEDQLKEKDEHIEELHEEYEKEIKQQLENQRVLLTRRARAVKLAALREKDKHMKMHIERVTAHVSDLAERSRQLQQDKTAAATLSLSPARSLTKMFKKKDHHSTDDIEFFQNLKLKSTDVNVKEDEKDEIDE